MFSKRFLVYSGVTLSVLTLFSIAYIDTLVSSVRKFNILAAVAGAKLYMRAPFRAADPMASSMRTTRTNALGDDGDHGGVNEAQDPTGAGRGILAHQGGPLSSVLNWPQAAPHETLSDEHFRTTMEELQRVRQLSLRSACAAAAHLPPRRSHEEIRPPFVRTFNVPSLGITYCAIAKCATTTFRNFLTNLTGNRCYGLVGRAGYDINTPCTARNVTRPRSFDDFERQSVLIVRNPWGRLVSSYLNKFVVERHRLAEPCYVRHRRKLRGGRPITFAQFVDCLLEDHRRGQPLNIHFAPMHWQCSPCNAKYTYIINLETFMDDFKYLAKYVFPNTTTYEEYERALKSIKRRSNESSNRTAITYRKCYESLSQTSMNSLKELYAADADYYGYPSLPL